MSSEDEDDCDVYYQVGMENDLIINENNDDQLVVDNLQNWSTTLNPKANTHILISTRFR